MVDPTMSNTNELEQLDISIQRAREHVEFGNALERLLTNRDFKKVITEGYFEQEAVRLVHLKADEKMQDNASQGFIVRQMDAIGTLKQFLRTKSYLSAQAVRSIEADEATRTELLLEGAE